MLTPNQKAMVAAAMQNAHAMRESARQQRTQLAMKMATGGGQALTSAKPKAKAAGTKPKAAAATPQSSITPYLNASDLMTLNDATSNAEGADANARFGLANAAASALRASGDVERGRVHNVSAANDNAAARGIYDSGIRAGNVGMANADAARGMANVQGGLALAAAQAVGQRNAARSTFAGQLQALTAKAAENGAALPVDPYAAGNRPGQSTPRKVKVKR